ncbi:hypothetical protein [Neobacillus citreus]|uniref:Uncharacterized protein n=1 Tax=Neobacillus citreus TaxID=2833578 RepID=A0A942T133_9BACI|nr:hypothetical protein [Neobacillus citreus]MCH6267814.1 hypothetical protein [Neobacillus citreus]
MMGSYGMMGGTMGVVMCILMWLIGLAVIGGVVYFAVKLALRNQKMN